MSLDLVKEFLEWIRYWAKKIVMAFQYVVDWKGENIDPYFETVAEEETEAE
ncbi:MAG: hypothetical protein IJK02_04495 [Clostridia bacterium]|nr:hypothetical protein [Clostridia bacterium]MBR0537913.1 hypothetical protein [Clostridia bacterium]